jgi:probable F420-dependent oxidoreductase
MNHWLSLVNVAEVDQYIEIARIAEELGFHGISVADHLVIPTVVESKYPYTPGGETWWPDDTPWPDPWVTLTALGIATKHIKLATNIYLAALRDPFTAARAIGTAAVLTNNRVVCGLSAGWLKEEFDLLGIDFKSRGRRLDEMIVLMRKLWSGEVVEHQGEFFQVSNALMCPAPSEAVRIWSGGASKPALRRAAANDGWLGVPMFKAQFLETLGELKRMRKEFAREAEPMDICFGLLEPLTPELAAELDSLGASNNMVMPWMITPWGRTPWLKDDEDPASLDVKKRVMERFAEQVIQAS